MVTSAPHARSTNALVVIPTLNEAQNIVSCIRTLARGNDATIVVVDGGSTDGTQRLVWELRNRIPRLHFIHNRDRVQSAGINLAVRQCAQDHHDILIRCDAHSIYPPDYVTRLCAILAEKQASSVVVPMDAHGDTEFARAAAWVVDTPLGNGGAPHRGGLRSGWVEHGHHAAFDLRWFRQISGYDPRFTHNEDAEYDYRLCRAGGEIWLTSDVRITYMMRPTLSGLARQYFTYGGGRAQTLTKHRIRGRLRQILPVVNFIGQGLSLLLSPIFALSLLLPALYLAVCLLMSLLAAAKLRRISGLWAGVALVVMHHAWAWGFIRYRLRHRASRKKLRPQIVYQRERW